MGLVQATDLFATIEAIASSSATTDEDSVSLIPLLKSSDPVTSVRDYIFTQKSDTDWAVRNMELVK